MHDAERRRSGITCETAGGGNPMGLKKTALIWLPVSMWLCLQSSLFPQESVKNNYESLSLEELLNVKIAVASKINMTQRESPGIISVINRTEIMNSGARDLIDILLTVPGFGIASDVQNTAGIGIRGSWAHEGKVLMLVDGQEFNENLYSTLQLGNHFPVEQIERIEIIRGPGSATYGGYAELGVINIITRSAADVNGVAASVSYGQMEKAYARRTVNFSFGKQLKDFGVVAHTFWGQGNRSDRNYTDAYGTTFDMKGNSDLDPFNVNVGLGYKGLSARVLVDRFHSTTRDWYDQSYDQPLENDFNSYLMEVKYNLKLGSKVSLSPKFNFKRQSPWLCTSADCRAKNAYSGKTAERVGGNLVLSYDVSSRLNLLAGGDLYQDRASAAADAPSYDLFQNEARSIDFSNSAFFVQGQAKTSLADITVGARMDDHSQAGTSYSPRFGLTKVKGKFHLKSLIGWAFRAPSIENLMLNPAIKPERTKVMELEVGYQVTRDSLLTGNIFNSRIKKPIIYGYDPAFDTETYLNFEETGTRGFELDYREKKQWGYINMNYSYYRAIDNKVSDYSVAGHPELLLGFPAHKLAALANCRIGRNLALNPTVIFLSSRYGYVKPADTSSPIKFDPDILVNMNFTWHDFSAKGLELDFGVYDLFGQNLQFIQPYKGSHAPLPGPSREFRIRLGYNLNYSNE
jgi:outer membrane receptor for ferrienterochelin and colicin